MRQTLESDESVAVHPDEPAPVPDRSGYAELYERSYDELLQQTYLLTAGHHRLAGQAVRRAFEAAWTSWAEAATDPDPVRWLRTRAFSTALAPWHPGGPPRHRRLRAPWRPARTAAETTAADPAAAADRALLGALHRLSRARRHVLVLHDALGLAPGEIALEVEASSTAVEHRLRAAHLELARALPERVGADPLAPGFGERLGGLLYETAVRHCPPPEAAGQPVPRALPARARLRAAALPAASGLLVLVTAAAIAGTLDGHGPSAYFDRPPTPAPLCTSSLNGSAGPATPAHFPGMRSLWCAEDGPHAQMPLPGPVIRSGERQQAASAD
ncbi:RNA polymerase sigma factor [Kitasatospora sp. NPDC008050]|uniref:RNA polymerase sigma factor n=1 Tax=Kitasatospora sp. NPDC008050 TaxID=3364021 RepID=UPI0036E785D2